MKFDLSKYMPLGSQVLLEVITKEKSDTGLIVFAQEKEEKFLKVVKSGSKCEYVKEGQFVLLGPTATTLELHHKGKTYKQVPEIVIAGIMTE